VVRIEVRPKDHSVLVERIEAKWIEAFAVTFTRCGIGAGDVVAVLSESQSRQILVELSELALHQIGARPFLLRMPSPALRSSVPLRSTGTSLALQQIKPAIAALATSHTVIDCTVEGLLHSIELPLILAGGARLMMISNEHPEILERLKPDPALLPLVEQARAWLTSAREMRVRSAAGTDLCIRIEGAPVRASAGLVSGATKVAYWPGGLCLCFPRHGAVNGRVVLDRGDVNLTFKRYFETPVVLTVEHDYVTRIEGEGLDSDLMRSYYVAFNDREAFGVSHVGWGLNPAARWDALAFYDKRDTNGTELRAFAGNFLFSTGANEYAKRFTMGHFDFPMRNCTVELDGSAVVRDGTLCQELRLNSQTP
jgi:2,5-dihydroxypyridine 5,6-dioxygenase